MTINQNKRCQNSCVPICNEEEIFVLVVLYYDGMKSNHTKNKLFDFWISGFFGIYGYISATKRATGVFLMSKRPDFRGLFSFSKKMTFWIPGFLDFWICFGFLANFFGFVDNFFKIYRRNFLDLSTNFFGFIDKIFWICRQFFFGFVNEMFWICRRK